MLLGKDVALVRDLSTSLTQEICRYSALQWVPEDTFSGSTIFQDSNAVLILCDIDPYDSVHRAKSLTRAGAELPLLATTRSQDPEVHADLLAAGVREVLVLPLQAALLRRAVDQVFEVV